MNAETESVEPEVKRGPGRPKKQDAPIEETKADAPEEEIPDGFGSCYVARPGCVSTGKGTKAKPGAKIVTGLATIKQLESRGLAFVDETEAKMAFKAWKRKVEDEREQRLAAFQRRLENRARWLEDKAKGEELPEWPA